LSSFPSARSATPWALRPFPTRRSSDLDLAWILAVARGGQHAGAAVREKARRVTVVFPERFGWREVDLRDGLARQLGDRLSLRARERRVERGPLQRAGGPRVHEVTCSDASAVRVADLHARSVDGDRDDLALELDGHAQVLGHRLRNALHAVACRESQAALRSELSLRLRE